MSDNSSSSSDSISDSIESGNISIDSDFDTNRSYDIQLLNETIESINNGSAEAKIKENIANKIFQQEEQFKRSLKNQSNSKIVSLETKEDRKYFEDCERFLSYESISKVVLQSDGKRCCKKNCIQRISVNHSKCDFSESTEFVYLLRTKLLGKNKTQRSEKMFDLLKGNISISFFY